MNGNNIHWKDPFKKSPENSKVMNGTNLEPQNKDLNSQNDINNSLRLKKCKTEFIVRGSIYHNYNNKFQKFQAQKNDNYSNELQNQGDLMNKPNNFMPQNLYVNNNSNLQFQNNDNNNTNNNFNQNIYNNNNLNNNNTLNNTIISPKKIFFSQSFDGGIIRCEKREG